MSFQANPETCLSQVEGLGLHASLYCALEVTVLIHIFGLLSSKQDKYRQHIVLVANKQKWEAKLSLKCKGRSAMTKNVAELGNLEFFGEMATFLQQPSEV